MLREAFRVLKPGGRFAVSDVIVRGEVPADVRRSMELWVGCIAGALEEGEYAAKLRAAGFEDVEVEPWRIYDAEFRERVRAGAQAGSQAVLRAGVLRGMSWTHMRALVAESIGTALLLAAVVGSGIMGERLAGGNVAIALLANTLATGAALVALILTFGPVSGAHFNPVVSFADASQGGLTWPQAGAYTAAQLVGAVTGVGAADVMFEVPRVRLVAACPERTAAGVQRGRGDVRPACRDLGLLAPPAGRRRRLPWAPTSRRRTGSPPRRRSRTPPSRSRAR